MLFLVKAKVRFTLLDKILLNKLDKNKSKTI